MKDVKQFIKAMIRGVLNENLLSNDVEEYIEQVWCDLDHWFTPSVCLNLETTYGLNLSDYESDEYRLKSRTDVYDFGILNRSEHNKCLWWKEIVKKSKQEPIKYNFLKDMVFFEMKSYFYDYLYKDDLKFKNNFQIIFNKFLTEMIDNIINSKIEGGEKYDITSLKQGMN
jgi:hypothetical protein